MKCISLLREVKDIREKSTKAGLGSTDLSFNLGID